MCSFDETENCSIIPRHAPICKIIEIDTWEAVYSFRDWRISDAIFLDPLLQAPLHSGFLA